MFCLLNSITKKLVNLVNHIIILIAITVIVIFMMITFDNTSNFHSPRYSRLISVYVSCNSPKRRKPKE
jgi:hypothetical protein